METRINGLIINMQGVAEMKLTPTQLADLWWAMDGEQQGEFFNRIGYYSSEHGNPVAFQLQSVTDSKSINSSGRKVMEMIGEYAAKTN